MLLCNMNIIQTAVNWEFPDFCHLCKKTETLHLILAFFPQHAMILCRNSLEKHCSKAATCLQKAMAASHLVNH